ncbi:zinc metalloprotease [Curvivirga sp.]|uniref:zinc metalloprotease n=1 Tax=Curvivirga sp. TaxID=2856848 RepID=UPI003B5A514F
MQRRQFIKAGCATIAAIGIHPFSSAKALTRKCGVKTPPLNVRRKVEGQLKAFRMHSMSMLTNKKIVIPIHYHIIHAGSEGKISEKDIAAQTDVLNKDLQPYGITFTQKAVDYYDNEDWYVADMIDHVKAKLGKDPTSCLNFYSSGLLQSGLLGYATFPWDKKDLGLMDGVVCNASTFPNGEEPYNLGRTATHEVGHWLGLFHTFQDGCSGNGDEVADTIAHDQPDYGCPSQSKQQACDGKSFSPLNNFMNYSDDQCLTELSEGQMARIKEMVGKYRPEFLVAGNDAPTTSPVASESGYQSITGEGSSDTVIGGGSEGTFAITE